MKKSICEGAKCMFVGRLGPDPEWSARKHSHPFVEMLVPMGGRMRVEVGGRRFDARAGDAFLYPADAAHQEWSDAKSPAEFVFFGCEGDLGALPVHAHDPSGRIRMLARWMHEEGHSAYEGRRRIADLYLRALLEEYRRASAGRSSELVESSRACMRERLCEPICVKDLADRAGMSRAHFIRTYKRLSGRAPMEDLRLLRAEAARDLIVTTDLPLKTIAPKVGFCDEYHLSRVFRRQLRATPGSFRKRR